jgi:2-succinyl-5-enolpyruvyl-6-hydroxy-3-cyclohexene-1-carboxylate synthase
VAVICTSGTATANLFPAVIEAYESGVPLIVLTADRPPELRDCAAGQTIDQTKLYGRYVCHYHELAVPDRSSERLAYLRQTVAASVRMALSAEGGPVHLNCPFRDPLPPIPEVGAAEPKTSIGEEFFAHLGSDSETFRRRTRWSIGASQRGLIVAGPDNPVDPQAYAEKVAGWARQLGWPVLADALSPLRHYAPVGATVIGGYDAILRDSAAAQALQPEVVICLGGWPTSKVLRQWTERSAPRIWMISRSDRNRDGLHGHTVTLVGDVVEMELSETPASDGAYASEWREREAAVSSLWVERFTAAQELFEPKASWLLARHLPVDTTVVVANSMPVRDLEYFWPVGGRQIRVLFNRGANGIDGTLSTALGVAHVGGPVVLLTGDLSLLHDTNGFLASAQSRGGLTVVLINNQGGGIFEHLPVAQFGERFERYIATPQHVDFGKLCAAYDVPHRRVASWDEFVPLIAQLPSSGMRVLEIATDRRADAAKRKEWMKG